MHMQAHLFTGGNRPINPDDRDLVHFLSCITQQTRLKKKKKKTETFHPVIHVPIQIFQRKPILFTIGGTIIPTPPEVKPRHSTSDKASRWSLLKRSHSKRKRKKERKKKQSFLHLYTLNTTQLNHSSPVPNQKQQSNQILLPINRQNDPKPLTQDPKFPPVQTHS